MPNKYIPSDGYLLQELRDRGGVLAIDALAAHLAGTETFTGAKTFSAGAVFQSGLTVSAGGLQLTGNIRDTNNNNILGFAATAAAVNYIQATNAATAGIPSFAAVGTDAFIGFNFSAKGGSTTIPQYAFYGTGGVNQLLTLVNNYTGASPNQVNYWEMDNAVPGVSPLLGVQGGVDVNVDLRMRPHGTGAVVFETDTPLPRGTMFRVAGTASAAANYLQVTSNSSGNPPQLMAAGTDANVGIYVVPKGSGFMQIASGGLQINGAASVSAAGSVNYGGTTAATATTGSAGAPPAQVAGYIIANAAGTQIKIPYYAN